jgi:hypothetical protein
VSHGPPEVEQHAADELVAVPHGPPEVEQHAPDEVAFEGGQRPPDGVVSLPLGPPEVEQHPPGEAAFVPPLAGPSGVERPKAYTTLAEDLAGMMPPGAISWVGPTLGIPEEIFTRNFGPNRSWQDALCECHQRLPAHCLYLEANSLRNLVWYQMKFWQQWSITLENCQRRRTIPPKGESVPVLSKAKRSLHCMRLSCAESFHTLNLPNHLFAGNKMYSLLLVAREAEARLKLNSMQLMRLH